MKILFLLLVCFLLLVSRHGGLGDSEWQPMEEGGGSAKCAKRAISILEIVCKVSVVLWVQRMCQQCLRARTGRLEFLIHNFVAPYSTISRERLSCRGETSRSQRVQPLQLLERLWEDDSLVGPIAYGYALLTNVNSEHGPSRQINASSAANGIPNCKSSSSLRQGLVLTASTQEFKTVSGAVRTWSLHVQPWCRSLGRFAECIGQERAERPRRGSDEYPA